GRDPARRGGPRGPARPLGDRDSARAPASGRPIVSAGPTPEPAYWVPAAIGAGSLARARGQAFDCCPYSEPRWVAVWRQGWHEEDAGLDRIGRHRAARRP